mmetsp:Transcript_47246/g.103057  ORF Transcript_47246/g.103057 Transcript_47246/m.103057 type:complete len:233 (-) Transcript_47246:426-1124(-)
MKPVITPPCICSSVRARPTSSGRSTRSRSQSPVRRHLPRWWYIFCEPPVGTPRTFRKNSVEPPKTRRKQQMIETVPFRRTSFVPGPSISSTHSSSCRVRTSAMPPRSPACHIMKRCLQESSSLCSLSSSFPAAALMPLARSPRGTTAARRPRRQKGMRRQPNFQPSDVWKATAMPTNMKTAMSAREASCLRKNAVSMFPSSPRWGVAVALIRIEQKSTAMIGDMEHTSSVKA